MSRLTPRGREIVLAARALVEESGPAALTMRALADHLGIKAPSLYKHFPDKAAVEAEVIALGLLETAEALEAAEEHFARSAPSTPSTPSVPSTPPTPSVPSVPFAPEPDSAADEPRTLLAALARAYRADALAHPHVYLLATERPLPRHALPEGLEARAAMPLMRACDYDVDRARAVWAFAHGMVSLEIHGRFPDGADLAAAWRAGVRALER
ncbi:WHG domain-containing protein [Streptomyces sp. NPDC005955]|uniref:TetR/AcrR family transcriptional regulator n=1 Tax=Streptomyces sp. NPDC005955 TaxID=3364738 RepID=UPI0036AD8D5E